MRAPLTIALFAAALAASPAHAETVLEPTLIVNGDDGYGTSDCLADGGRCGALVADALCRSRGHASSASFRRAGADEVTGSLSSPNISGSLFVVVCKPVS